MYIGSSEQILFNSPISLAPPPDDRHEELQRNLLPQAL
ncbi:MAG: hypothetical protein JKY61_03195 [Planctomycetes bacterium]|nr:hypothetical protein [Planctomycetota bacterium]